MFKRTYIHFINRCNQTRKKDLNILLRQLRAKNNNVDSNDILYNKLTMFAKQSTQNFYNFQY